MHRVLISITTLVVMAGVGMGRLSAQDPTAAPLPSDAGAYGANPEGSMKPGYVAPSPTATEKDAPTYYRFAAEPSVVEPGETASTAGTFDPAAFQQGPPMPESTSSDAGMEPDPTLGPDGRPRDLLGRLARLYVPCTFSADGLFLWRQTPPTQMLAQDFFTGTNVLDLTDIAPSMGSNVRFGAVVHYGWPDFEGIYYAIDNWNRSATATGLALVMPDVDPISIFDSAFGGYAYQLRNGEVNLRFKVANGFTVISGVRFNQLKEQLLLTGSLTGFGSTSVATNVKNDLYGGQLGADFAIGQAISPFYLNALIKGGIYSNQVEVTRSMVTTLGSTPSDIRLFDGHEAFVGEVSLKATYEFSRFVAVYGGYQVLWLGGIATSPDHASPTVTTIDDQQTAFFHGAFMGLNVNW